MNHLIHQYKERKNRKLQYNTHDNTNGTRETKLTSSGSITLPFDLDIFTPSLSRTIACRYTSLKGSWSVNCRDIITMRATQKKRISRPVSSKLPGKNPRKSGVSSGQPSTEKGKRPLLNHVSSTSSSCCKCMSASAFDPVYPNTCTTAARNTQGEISANWAQRNTSTTF